MGMMYVVYFTASGFVHGSVLQLSPSNITRNFYFQVNSKALLMFSGLLSEEVHENIFWPDLPYITDENGSKFIEFMVMLLVPWVVWYI